MTVSATTGRFAPALAPNGTHAYTADDLGAALRAVGVRTGDVLFAHVALDALGRAAGCATTDETDALVLGALRAAIGDEGTLLVPTYTFSFCRGEDFDPATSPTAGGPWSPTASFLERVRRLPGAVRSSDPIHSVAGVGPRAAELLGDVAPTCFGAGSVFDRLRAADARIVLLGLDLGEATFQHHVEEVVGVPFRYRKLFTGRVREGAHLRKRGWVYNVRILADNGYPDAARLEAAARQSGVCRAAPVGVGEVLGVSATEYFAFAEAMLRADPWATARGPAVDPVDAERERVGSRLAPVALPPNASAEQMVEALAPLPRHLVSEGYDVALEALAGQLPMTVHEFPSGSECWSWIVPEQWDCDEAYLETLDGRRLFSTADSPLHVVSFSRAFDGVVGREELLAHLHVHHLLPDAVPFIFKYYERDWGLCCTRAQRDALTDAHYRVVIRTRERFGTLKVGEVVAPGLTDETVVLCAHLCHPGQFNDDVSGVVVGVEVMRRLLARPAGRYTYRFLIVPETIGSVAWLTRHEALIPRLKGGLFLEMLGLDHPHALQLSFDGNTEADECFALALAAGDPYGWTGTFRTVIGNDERQFNAPGVRVPMLSLSRVLPPSAPAWPYAAYHSDLDVPGPGAARRLAESCDLAVRMLDTLEQNVVPVNRFRGEVFCSRYGVHVDWWENREGNKALFDVMYLVDGTRSLARIARECGISFAAARDTVAELRRNGLVEYRARGGA